MKQLLFTILLILFTLPLHAKIKVGTPIPPISFLVEKIGGDLVEVETALGAGQNPHVFSLSPKTITQLSQADLYLSIGLPLEARIVTMLQQKNGNKKVVISDIAHDIHRLPLLDQHHHHDHENDAHGTHQHDQEHLKVMGDTHIWTTPSNLKSMSKAVLLQLNSNSPRHKAEFEKNYQLLAAELDQVQKRIDQLLRPLAGRSVLIYHPSIQYLTNEFKIKLLTVETDGKEPSPKQLNKIISQAREAKAKSILIDAYLDARHIKSIIEMLQVKEVKLNLLNKQILTSIIQAAESIAAAEKN